MRGLYQELWHNWGKYEAHHTCEPPSFPMVYDNKYFIRNVCVISCFKDAGRKCLLSGSGRRDSEIEAWARFSRRITCFIAKRWSGQWSIAISEHWHRFLTGSRKFIFGPVSCKPRRNSLSAALRRTHVSSEHVPPPQAVGSTPTQPGTETAAVWQSAGPEARAERRRLFWLLGSGAGIDPLAWQKGPE